jgi:hypothetical protein
LIAPVLRRCCAGSGMPLPYNAQPAALQNFPLSIFNFPLAAAPLQRFIDTLIFP